MKHEVNIPGTSGTETSVGLNLSLKTKKKRKISNLNFFFENFISNLEKIFFFLKENNYFCGKFVCFSIKIFLKNAFIKEDNYFKDNFFLFKERYSILKKAMLFFKERSACLQKTIF